MKQLRVFVPDQPPGFANYHGKQDDLYLFLKALRKGTHIELHLFWPAESHEWSTATVRGEFDRLVERPACTPEIVLRPGFEGVEHDLLGDVGFSLSYVDSILLLIDEIVDERKTLHLKERST